MKMVLVIVIEKCLYIDRENACTSMQKQLCVADLNCAIANTLQSSSIHAMVCDE